MTPSTPPRSSVGISSRGKKGKETQDIPDLRLSPETPHRQSKFVAPVTPGTVSMKQQQQQQQLNSNRFRSPVHRSPFKGLKTPEYTPNNAGKRKLDLQQPGELSNVSRVLFPSEEKQVPSLSVTGSGRLGSKKQLSPLIFDNEDDVSVIGSLLPPKSMGSRSGIFSSFLEEEDLDEVTPQSRKQPKQVPGTPSDKIVTFQLAKDWNNNSGSCFSSDDGDDDETLIREQKLIDPFSSDDIPDKQTRLARKQQLLAENPELEETVTYVNKYGKTVKQRNLSKDEQERFKPQMLFAKELEDQKRDNKG